MKILIKCGGRFAIPSIQILDFEKCLAGIILATEEKSLAEQLEESSKKSSMPFLSIEKGQMGEMGEWIKQLNPDYIFSICFPHLIPQELLNWKPDAWINFHTGPLPGFRGAMPIFEVLRYGEKESAITIHKMDAAFDEGDIILTEKTPIEKGETFGSLAVKLSNLCAVAAQNMANMLNFASVIPCSPQDSSSARYFEFPAPEDTMVQWGRMPAEEIAQLVNACNPWNTGADAVLFGEQVKIIQAIVMDEKSSEAPGTILGFGEDKALKVSCDEQTILGVQFLRTDYGFTSANEFARLKRIT